MQMVPFGRGVSAPFGAPQAFCRRQNLDAGRIHFARADQMSEAPAKGSAFRGETEANACGFHKGDRGLILL